MRIGDRPLRVAAGLQFFLPSFAVVPPRGNDRSRGWRGVIIVGTKNSGLVRRRPPPPPPKGTPFVAGRPTDRGLPRSRNGGLSFPFRRSVGPSFRARALMAIGRTDGESVRPRLSVRPVRATKASRPPSFSS